MSTRSRISIINSDGKVRSIYCHHDGYLDHVGKKLVDFYDTERAINALLDLGDLSSLGNNPVSDKLYWKSPIHPLSFQDLEEFCLAYRDRGETDVDAKEFNSFEEFKKAFPDLQEEYNYVFMNGKWYYCENDWSGETLDDLRLVEDDL